MTHNHQEEIQQHDDHHQQQVTIGTVEVLIEDDDFVEGYDQGYESFHAHHPKAERIESSTFLFLFRNGWGTEHSDAWSSGYIMGWLAAFYERDMREYALSRYLSGSPPCSQRMRGSHEEDVQHHQLDSLKEQSPSQKARA